MFSSGLDGGLWNHFLFNFRLLCLFYYQEFCLLPVYCGISSSFALAHVT